MSHGGKLVAFVRPASEQNGRLLRGGTASDGNEITSRYKEILPDFEDVWKDVEENSKVKEISFDSHGTDSHCGI